MHQVGSFVQFTITKEEPQIIDRLVRAVATRRLSHYQMTTLFLVYRYMVLENRDIALSTFNNFRTVLAQLDIIEPNLHIRMSEGLYRGSRPQFPNRKTKNDLYMAAMSKRANRRTQEFENALSVYKMTREEFEAALSEANVTKVVKEEVGKVKEAVTKVATDLDAKFQEMLKLLGIDQNHPKAAEVKQNFLRLVVNNDR